MSCTRAIVAFLVLLAVSAPARAEPQLRQVVLSSGGVGQFTFEAQVNGAVTLKLDIKLDQVDDLLKSLVVADPAGPISGIRLPGREPLSESFRTLPFQPDAFASSEALLASLVGEHVRIPAIGAEGSILAVSAFDVPGAGSQNPVTRHRLIMAVGDTIRERGLTQQEAAQLCGTDQPTLSKVLRGRMESVTLDKLAAWLNALGRTVEIRIRPYDRGARTGELVVAP